MAENRTVTVSITINLGNYENLRLEVSDKAETKEEADALRYFLADVLDGYGNNNATAKAAIDKYKESILADADKEADMEVFSFEETPMTFVPVEETEYLEPAPEPVGDAPVVEDVAPEPEPEDSVPEEDGVVEE